MSSASIPLLLCALGTLVISISACLQWREQKRMQNRNRP